MKFRAMGWAIVFAMTLGAAPSAANTGELPVDDIVTAEAAPAAEVVTADKAPLEPESATEPAAPAAEEDTVTVAEVTTPASADSEPVAPATAEEPAAPAVEDTVPDGASEEPVSESAPVAEEEVPPVSGDAEPAPAVEECVPEQYAPVVSPSPLYDPHPTGLPTVVDVSWGGLTCEEVNYLFVAEYDRLTGEELTSSEPVEFTREDGTFEYVLPDSVFPARDGQNHEVWITVSGGTGSDSIVTFTRAWYADAFVTAFPDVGNVGYVIVEGNAVVTVTRVADGSVFGVYTTSAGFNLTEDLQVVAAATIEGEVLSPESRGPWILSPTVPQPEPLVTYGDWIDGTTDCEAGTVSQSREVTTTSFVWNGDEWLLDTANATVTTESGSRPMTSDELQACSPQPEPPSRGNGNGNGNSPDTHPGLANGAAEGWMKNWERWLERFLSKQ